MNRFKLATTIAGSGATRSFVSGRRWRVFMATAMVLLVGTSAAHAAAAPAPVPCTPAGSVNGLPKYNCEFYPSGNGFSGGSPVLSGDGTRVGFLRQAPTTSCASASVRRLAPALLQQ
jgi:hypothetical protein